MSESVMALLIKVYLPEGKKTTTVYDEVKKAIAQISPEFSEINLMYLVPRDADMDVSFSFEAKWLE
jgi:hypothetical protein